MPPWDAVTVQLPAPVRVMVVPDPEQFPNALKLTASADDAVALTANGESPYVRPGNEAKLIV